jgi:hypothetical protein
MILFSPEKSLLETPVVEKYSEAVSHMTFDMGVASQDISDRYLA